MTADHRDDVDRVPELSIECPVCKAKPGTWCHKERLGPGIHAKRIDAYNDDKR